MVTSTSSGCSSRPASSISATTSGSNFDTVLVVYDSAGHIVASNDDANEDAITSSVAYRSPRVRPTTT